MLPASDITDIQTQRGAHFLFLLLFSVLLVRSSPLRFSYFVSRVRDASVESMLCGVNVIALGARTSLSSLVARLPNRMPDARMVERRERESECRDERGAAAASEWN